MMKKLRRYYLFIILCLMLFFNIERLDFGQQNLINIQSEIYVLGGAIVILTLFVPGLNRMSVSTLLIFWTVIYLAIKLIPLSEHALFGGVYYYLTITELAFILLLAYLSQRLAFILNEYISATEALSLAGIDNSIPNLKDVNEQIQSEINRSRHFNRSMIVVLARADLTSAQITLPSLLAEVQASFIQRYLNTKVAHVVKGVLRRMDILATDHKAGRLVIINPETSVEEVDQILQRIQMAVESELGIRILMSTASFPDQAFSFDDLLKKAEKDLNPIPLSTEPIPPAMVEESKVDLWRDPSQR